jgi:cephalosporin hydroxylase
MKQLAREYDIAANSPSDINEHIPTLRHYAGRVRRVAEMGIRQGISTIGLLSARLDGPTPEVYRGYDLRPCPARIIQIAEGITPFDFTATTGDSRLVTIPETDLLFIDTRHTYEHLDAELRAHEPLVREYIVLHDTDTYRDHDEGGGGRGLQPAIDEFLARHGGAWELEEHWANNNGLTVLVRV